MIKNISLSIIWIGPKCLSLDSTAISQLSQNRRLIQTKKYTRPLRPNEVFPSLSLDLTRNSDVVGLAVGVLLGDGCCRPVQGPGQGDVGADRVLDAAVASLPPDAS